MSAMSDYTMFLGFVRVCCRGTCQRRFSFNLLLLLLVLPVAAFADSVPDGWTESLDSKRNAIEYRPVDKKANVIVKIYPSTLLENQGPETWLLNRLYDSNAPRGEWVSEPEVVRQTANIASGKRRFKAESGATGIIDAVVFSADRQYVRMAVSIYSNNDANKQYLKQANKFMANVVSLEKKDALAEHRGVDIEASPPEVAGISSGGVLKVGRYVGAKVSQRDNKIIRRIEVTIHANGEFEFLEGRSGNYVYSQATGRLDLDRDMKNNTREPSAEFVIYGTNDKSNKPIIYAEEGYLGRYVTRLVWSGEPKGLAPTIRKEAEKLAKESEQRYKFVTNAGNGIQVPEIEAIIYTSDLETRVGGVALDTEAYVLMKDGRVMDNMPVAPTILDVAKSRSREPDRWGWWKAEEDRFSFAWSVDSNRYTMPKGNQSIAKPIARGTRLNGTWMRSESMMTTHYSSVKRWGYHLTEDGRFEKFFNSSNQAGGESTGTGPLVTSFSDDEGSITTVTGSDIGGGVSSKSNRPKADRQGWYEFDGYNLKLKFDNGTEKHTLTFSVGDDMGTIWIDGEGLQRSKK